MIYKGIRLYSEPISERVGYWPFRKTIETGRIEYTGAIMFDMDDVKYFEEYLYTDRFESFVGKIFVMLHNSGDVFILHESFANFQQLYLARRIHPVLHVSESFKLVNLETTDK